MSLSRYKRALDFAKRVNHTMLTTEQRTSWDDNGFLILSNFYSDIDVDRIDFITEMAWRGRPRTVVVDDTVTGQRQRLSSWPRSRDESFVKVNDLYLESGALRRLILDTRLVPILAGLLGDEAVLINTLTIDHGTAQDNHIDSLFMTPRTTDALLATWTCLEDVHGDAGPLFYYPGSHKLPVYRFSNGAEHAIHEEMGDWDLSFRRFIAEHGIERKVFLAKKGDLFVWHSRLIHGGSPINDPERTRKSLVSHFHTLADWRAFGGDCVPCNGAYWLRRDSHPVPRDELPPVTLAI